MADPTLILKLAVPTPLRRLFDYLPPPGIKRDQLQPGCRLRVPFGRGQAVAVLVARGGHSDIEPRRLRPAAALLDKAPLIPDELLRLARWAADYYHHPVGEVFQLLLPAPLRKGRPAVLPASPLRWRLSDAGAAVNPDTLKRAPRQAALLSALAAQPGRGLDESALRVAGGGSWRKTLAGLREKGWIEAAPPPGGAPRAEVAPTVSLNAEQATAVAAIEEAAGRYQAFLLDGVTGSGKTEVYLHAIRQTLAQGKQALVLVPEIALTPQLLARFSQRLPGPPAVWHSGLSERERLATWLGAKSGAAAVIIGTRSAVFLPLARAGLIILDEEHDPSFKQQDGFRYHARDVAVWRAHQLGIPVVLGSATPALETLHNAALGRYRHLRLPHRAGNARPPRLRLADMRGLNPDSVLSPTLLKAMDEHLSSGNQVLLFLNRRGYAPVLLCPRCGWLAQCHHCDARMIYHHSEQRLRCHHCGAGQRAPRHCPKCAGEKLKLLGHGTERVESALAQHFPGTPVARIDRDTTARKGELERALKAAHSGAARILVGTQMLAKGHHLPAVTLAAVLNADQGLFGADFRASERLAQLIVQVAGRAGRGEQTGEVIIQTYHSDHPLLRTLLTQGYGAYAQAALDERRLAALAPFSYLALLRAEAPGTQAPMRFLQAAADLGRHAPVTLLGPVPAPMEKRAGRYRAQLLLQAELRPVLHRFLRQWLPEVEALPLGRKVRWSLDVDPGDML
ncbi:MAG TPA: primosomal protein N' [Gammaproteobacteria bacterium]|nr:primosomal protein N' [Gammaproteobacteria bacterium]